MRLLFDQNLSSRLCHLLGDLFPESVQVRELGLERATDRVIWEYARSHGYVVVSQDADFANLTAYLGAPPKVVWLRCGNRPTAVIERLLRAQSEAIGDLDGDESKTILEVLMTSDAP